MQRIQDTIRCRKCTAKAAFGSALIGCLMAATVLPAQQPGQRTMGKYGWRWRSPERYDNTTFVMPLSSLGYGYVDYPPGYYGYMPYLGYAPYGGYSPYVGGIPYAGASPYFGNSYVAPDPYVDSAVARATLLQAQANATRAQAEAAASKAEAAVAVEQARAQYLENVVRFKEIRTKQKAADELEEQKAMEERRASAANYVPPTPTQLYSRLSADELDPATGQIVWPKVLLRMEFAAGRRAIEQELVVIAKQGANAGSASRIRDSANALKAVAESLVAEIGFQPYRNIREFLGSLSVEGYYALEEQ